MTVNVCTRTVKSNKKNVEYFSLFSIGTYLGENLFSCHVYVCVCVCSVNFSLVRHWFARQTRLRHVFVTIVTVIFLSLYVHWERTHMCMSIVCFFSLLFIWVFDFFPYVSMDKEKETCKQKSVCLCVFFIIIWFFSFSFIFSVLTLCRIRTYKHIQTHKQLLWQQTIISSWNRFLFILFLLSPHQFNPRHVSRAVYTRRCHTHKHTHTNTNNNQKNDIK